MSNMDLSQLVTAAARAQAQADDHAAAVKAICRARILSAFPFEAQQNIAQAVAVHTAQTLHSGDAAAAHAASGMDQTDIAQVAAVRTWVTQMQATCRDLSADMSCDPRDPAVWPALPAAAAALVSRF